MPWCAPSMMPGMSATTKRPVPGKPDDAEVGLEGGERIVRDLGTRRRDDREQRALPGVGLADQADVGDELEHQLDLRAPRLPRPAPTRAAPGGWTWRTARCPGRRGRLAPRAACRPRGAPRPAARRCRHRERRCRAGPADRRPSDEAPVWVLPLAVLAPLRLPQVAIAVVEQGGEVGVAADVDAAAVPAVSPVGPALGLVLEAGEGAGAGPAGAGRPPARPRDR